MKDNKDDMGQDFVAKICRYHDISISFQYMLTLILFI